MVRVEYTLRDGMVRKVRGWDPRLHEGLLVIDQPVDDGGEIRMVCTTLGSVSQFADFRVRATDGTLDEMMARINSLAPDEQEFLQ